MDIVNELTDAHLRFWKDSYPNAAPITMRCPDGLENCNDCGAVHHIGPDGIREIHVAWKPNEIELADLARGGTLWLSVVGNLPPHYLTVQAPE